MVSATVPKDLMVPDGTGDVEEVPEKTLGSADIFSNNEQCAEVFDKCLQAVDRRISKILSGEQSVRNGNILNSLPLPAPNVGWRISCPRLWPIAGGSAHWRQGS